MADEFNILPVWLDVGKTHCLLILAQDILLKKEPHREIVLGELSEYVRIEN